MMQHRINRSKSFLYPFRQRFSLCTLGALIFHNLVATPSLAGGGFSGDRIGLPESEYAHLLHEMENLPEAILEDRPTFPHQALANKAPVASAGEALNDLVEAHSTPPRELGEIDRNHCI